MGYRFFEMDNSETLTSRFPLMSYESKVRLVDMENGMLEMFQDYDGEDDDHNEDYGCDMITLSRREAIELATAILNHFGLEQ